MIIQNSVKLKWFGSFSGSSDLSDGHNAPTQETDQPAKYLNEYYIPNILTKII